MGYADDTTFYAAIRRPLSCPQVIESLYQDTVEINFWCLKRHMRLNSKKTKSMVVSWSRPITTCYGDLTLGGAVLDKVNGLRTL